MKRNFDLIRRIMVHVEKVPPNHFVDEVSLQYLSDEYGQEIVLQHVKLLMEENFLKGKIHQNHNDVIDKIRITEITWKGHDFIEAAQDDSIWNKAKETVLKPTVSITFSLLLEWLKQEAKIKLGLS